MRLFLPILALFTERPEGGFAEVSLHDPAQQSTSVGISRVSAVPVGWEALRYLAASHKVAGS